MRPLIFLLLSVLLMSASCSKEARPELVDFVFVAPLTITPGADTVARGDTLWLTVNFSDSLLDLRSNRRYRVRPQDLELITSIGFRKLLGPTQYAGSFAQGFTVLPKVGEVAAGGATFRRLKLVYDGQRYRARVGIIPLVAGIYALNLLNANETPTQLPFLPLEPGPDGGARSAFLRGIYYIVNDGDVHFSLLQQHSRITSTLPGAAESAILYEQKGTFAFVVR